MEKSPLEELLENVEEYFEEDLKPGPCRQISIDSQLNQIILKLDGVELYKQYINVLDREINIEFIDSLLDAWRSEQTDVLVKELKMEGGESEM